MGKLQDAWKKAKKDFETATGQKKPSEKLFAFLRKGTGIEASLKALDAEPTPTTCQAFFKAGEAYEKILGEEAKSSKTDPKVKDACKALLKALETVARDARKTVDAEFYRSETREFELRYDLSGDTDAVALTIAKLPLTVFVSAKVSLDFPKVNPAKVTIEKFIDVAKKNVSGLVDKYDALILKSSADERQPLLEKLNVAISRITAQATSDLESDPNTSVAVFCKGFSPHEIRSIDIWTQMADPPKVLIDQAWERSQGAGGKEKRKLPFKYELAHEKMAKCLVIPKIKLNLFVTLEVATGTPARSDPEKRIQGEIERWVGIYLKQIGDFIGSVDREIPKQSGAQRLTATAELHQKMLRLGVFFGDFKEWKLRVERIVDVDGLPVAVVDVSGNVETQGRVSLKPEWDEL